MAFARKLHELRVAKRLSLQDVADRLELSKAHVWNLEKGISGNPSIETVIKFAELYQVSVAHLIGENPDDPEVEPEMVAMFRDLKGLDDRDRETIRVLMEQLKRQSTQKEH